MNNVKFVLFIIVSMGFVGIVVDDVKDGIPITFLVLQTIAIFVAAYLDKQRENDDRWIYAAGLGYVVVTLVFIVGNYLLQ
ncbi:hypothetical protein [Sulfurovum sp.]|uniref:hypothetical protein n=1 Tax=Sulfurovum sp. TaxID=1969726 RepID=UPI0035643098